MYSGDEFYGDEITSPTERPFVRHDNPNTLKAWLARLDKIVWKRVGCSLDDLEDFNTYAAWEDGYTPSAFFIEVIAPEIGVE